MRIAGSHSCDKFFLAFVLHPSWGASLLKDNANHVSYGFSSTLTGNDYIIPLRDFTMFFPGQFTHYELAHDMWDTAQQNALDYSGRAHWGRSKRYAVAVPHTLSHIQDKYR